MSKKILIVDDSKVVVAALSMRLTAAGYSVLSAAEGGDAVSIARHERPDAIVLDVSLPPDVGFDGGVAWDAFLIMDWLRRLDPNWTVPIIVMTGTQDERLCQRAMDSGAVAFFFKPIDPEQLLEVIQKVLGEVPA